MPNKFTAAAVQCLSLLVALATLTHVSLAQRGTGSAGGMLSDRTHYLLVYRGSPPDAAVELLVLLRGAPGWQQQPRDAGLASRAEASASIRRREPQRFSLQIASVRFECAYMADTRTFTWAGRDYQLDSVNVIVIDRIDGAGGPPEIVRQLSLPFPPYTAGPAAAQLLRDLPQLREFM